MSFPENLKNGLILATNNKFINIISCNKSKKAIDIFVKGFMKKG